MITEAELLEPPPGMAHERKAAEAAICTIPFPKDANHFPRLVMIQILTATFFEYTATEKLNGRPRLATLQKNVVLEQRALRTSMKLIFEEQKHEALLFGHLVDVLRDTDETTAREEGDRIRASWHGELEAALRVLTRLVVDIDGTAENISELVALPIGNTSGNKARDRLIWQLFERYCEGISVDPLSVGFSPTPPKGGPFEGFYAFLEAGFSVFFPDEKFLEIKSLCDKMPTLRALYSAT